jgi:hypothetical protein
METSDPRDWTVAEVGAWIELIGLPQYKTRFESLQIDGYMMARANDNDLFRDIGIKIRLHRVKILGFFKDKVDAYDQEQERNSRYDYD